MSRIESYVNWFNNKNCEVIGHMKGIFFGLSTERLFVNVEDAKIAEDFFEFSAANFDKKVKIEEISFPAIICIIQDLGLDAKVSFFYDSNIVRECIDQLVTDYEAKLAIKSEGVHKVEILTGDPDAFCVDLNQIVYISKPRSYDKHNAANFSITNRNSDPFRVEFQSTTKAKEAYEELSKLFKDK